MPGNIAFFSGTSNPELAKQVAGKLGLRQERLVLKKFSDNETYCRLESEVRGKTVVLLQSLNDPANDYFFELCLMANAAKNNGAKKVVAVIPYLGYARQDRVTKKGEPVSIEFMAKALKAAGIDSVVSMDVHSKMASRFFGKSLKQVFAFPALMRYFKKKKLKQLVVVSPDKGALKNSKKYAKALRAGFAAIEKVRSRAEKIDEMTLKGNVEGKNVLMVDDLIGTGGTIVKAAELLKRKGAENVFVGTTHGVFAGEALKKLGKAPVKELIVCNSIGQHGKLKKMRVVSVAEELAHAVKRVLN